MLGTEEGAGGHRVNQEQGLITVLKGLTGWWGVSKQRHLLWDVTQGVSSQRWARSHLHFPEKETEAQGGHQIISSRARIQSHTVNLQILDLKEPEGPPLENALVFLVPESCFL